MENNTIVFIFLADKISRDRLLRRWQHKG